MKHFKYLLSITLIIMISQACKKQDHYYKDFIKDGEIIYVGKADAVSVHPGKNRIKLSWNMSDANISKVKIYWNNRTDSLLLNVLENTGNMSTVIENLEERNYQFEIYTLDAGGNTSIKVNAEGEVYGDNYSATLLNRILNNATYLNNTATINWFNANAKTVHTEIVYDDKDGVSHTIVLLPADSQTILSLVNPNLIFKYRTLYLPDPLAIDTFYTEYITVPVK
jgi:hypothetical protein